MRKQNWLLSQIKSVKSDFGYFFLFQNSFDVVTNFSSLKAIYSWVRYFDKNLAKLRPK